LVRLWSALFSREDQLSGEGAFLLFPSSLPVWGVILKSCITRKDKQMRLGAEDKYIKTYLGVGTCSNYA
jgi:hypothetical protein